MKFTHLSMQIFSTCGTSTCNNLIMVCRGNFPLQVDTHSDVGTQVAGFLASSPGVTRILPF